MIIIILFKIFLKMLIPTVTIQNVFLNNALFVHANYGLV